MASLFRKLLTPKGIVSVIALTTSSLYLLRKWFAGGVVEHSLLQQSLEDKVCLITGGNTGIGFEVAKKLAQMGATVVIASRNEEKAKQAVKQIQQQLSSQKSNNNKQIVDYVLMDLSDLDSVRQGVKQFEQKGLQLHLLVNNAGSFVINRATSKQGIELTFAQNYLGHFLLTNLLLEKIRESSGRIINVSSRAHEKYRGGAIFFDELESDCKNRSWWELYAHSKHAQILFTYELERRLRQLDQQTPTNSGAGGATAHVLHPGVVRTAIWRGWDIFAAPFTYLVWKSPEEGAQTILHCALAKDIKGGQYWSDCAPVPSRGKSHDIGLQQKLWNVSEKLCKLEQ